VLASGIEPEFVETRDVGEGTADPKTSASSTIILCKREDYYEHELKSHWSAIGGRVTQSCMTPGGDPLHIFLDA